MYVVQTHPSASASHQSSSSSCLGRAITSTRSPTLATLGCIRAATVASTSQKTFEKQHRPGLARLSRSPVGSEQFRSQEPTQAIVFQKETRNTGNGLRSAGISLLPAGPAQLGPRVDWLAVFAGECALSTAVWPAGEIPCQLSSELPRFTGGRRSQSAVPRTRILLRPLHSSLMNDPTGTCTGLEQCRQCVRDSTF